MRPPCCVCVHTCVRRKFASNWSVYPKFLFSFALLQASSASCLLNFQQSAIQLVNAPSSVVGVLSARKLRAANAASWHALWNTCIFIMVFFFEGKNNTMANLTVFLFQSDSNKHSTTSEIWSEICLYNTPIRHAWHIVLSQELQTRDVGENLHNR
jgi:hypothetical protein